MREKKGTEAQSGKIPMLRIDNGYMRKKILVAPSILACNLLSIGTQLKQVEKAGADLIHIDIMDGHFVPNLSFGPGLVRSIRPLTNLPLDVHLMIDNPEKFIEPFANAGSDFLGVQMEVCKGKRMEKALNLIGSKGVKKTIVINPDTDIKPLIPFLKDIDMVLFMTVTPGFGGQKFIPSVLDKIERLSKIWNGAIEVDGGINKETAKSCIDAGANVIVAGTYIFQSKNMRQTIRKLKEIK
jgi:ribulose-phosphate 3-epimerase